MTSRPPLPQAGRTNPYEAPQSTPEAAAGDERPSWVRLGLWGLNTRAKAWVFLWLCLVLAVIGLLFRVWPGLIMLLAVAWYWGAIRWMDRHDRW